MTTPTRVYRFTQHVRHPETGELLCSFDRLKSELSERRTIKKWAVILHDEDAAEDHVQGVLATEKDISPETIARWLDLPDRAVQRVRGGRAGLVDCLRYLTHEDPYQHQTLGKVRYPDDKVHSSPGWDWRAEVNELMERRLSGGSARGRSKSLAMAVTNGMSVREAVRRGATSLNALRRNRAAYLLTAPLPPMRFTYAVTGRDSVLRDTIALGLARQLAGDPAGVCELPFSADEYDGERVLLWRNLARPEGQSMRGWDNLDVASLFALSPSPRHVPTRYGMTQFVHDHLVVSGEDFESVQRRLQRCLYSLSEVDKLMGVTDPDAERTSFLHLPIRLPFTNDTLSIHVNAAVIGVGDYREVEALGNFRLGLVDAMNKARHVQPPEARRELEGQILARQFAPVNEARELIANELTASTDDFSDVLDGLGERICEG